MSQKPFDAHILVALVGLSITANKLCVWVRPGLLSICCVHLICNLVCFWKVLDAYPRHETVQYHKQPSGDVVQNSSCVPMEGKTRRRHDSTTTENCSIHMLYQRLLYCLCLDVSLSRNIPTSLTAAMFVIVWETEVSPKMNSELNTAPYRVYCLTTVEVMPYLSINWCVHQQW